MVEANAPADRHPFVYGRFRTDKPAVDGFSAELVHSEVDLAHCDDFNKLPILDNPTKSILELFVNTVKQNPNRPFLGTRPPQADGTFGPYEWKTYQEVYTIYEEIAKGAKSLNLFRTIPGINEDGKEWSFCGIWSKNRWEWHTSQLSAMVCKATVIGFYDSMGDSSVDYCLKQTQLETMFVSAAYLKKMLDMRAQGMAEHIKSIVLFDTDASTEEQKARAHSEFGISVMTLDFVREAGRTQGASIELNADDVGRDDIYMLNYTSGTTGDSKGVKISHWGVLSSAFIYMELAQMTREDIVIDYLPAPHVFDQFMFIATIIAGSAQGYYQGNPLKLAEDCQALQPTLFPSVPRLYNKFYDRIKSQFDNATGCKAWLINRGLSSKQHYLTEQDRAAYTSACYDSLIFGKVKKLLGGRVRLMITASAPISKDVLELMKICFCCPVMEAYGLSETSGAVTVSHPEDPISGTVGGPIKHCAVRLKDLPDMDYRITDKPYPRGEICMRSPCITPGYFMRPDKTAEAIDSEGFLHSGDVGVIFPNGAIKILDRSKNIFKLSQGEYVAPEKVENILIQSNFIAQIMVYGDSMQSCCVAILVPDEAAMGKWATENGKDVASVIESQDGDFKKVLLDEINRLGALRKLNSLEKPKDIFMTREQFSVDNEILTPTFKLKRNVGKKVYQKQIDDLYAAIAAKFAAMAK